MSGKKVIAIIESGGTGLEVAGIFKIFLNKIYPGEVDYLSFKEKFGYLPHTFEGIKKKYYSNDRSELKKIIQKEVKDLKKFYNIARKEAIGMFRTAINAETLYYVRRDVKKLKMVILPVKINSVNKRIIFIRDQIQGYYTNEKFLIKNDKIKIYSSFSKTNFLILVKFIKKLVEESDLKIYDLLFVYKFHLFGLELEKMIETSVKQVRLGGVRNFSILQPDTAMHKLLNELPKLKNKNIVVVTGNEIGDMMLETLINYYKIASKETFFTLNVAFVDKSNPLEVLQTMHGSADDIAGKQLLNPIATIRAAGYALEKWLGVPNAIGRTERAISKAIKNKIVTKDMGGKSKTNDVVNFILNNWK